MLIFGLASKFESCFIKQTLTCSALRAAAFTNTTSGSEFVSRNGRWLSDPVVVLRANSSSALLQLANPVYDAAAKNVTFQVGALPCPEMKWGVAAWASACMHVWGVHFLSKE